MPESIALSNVAAERALTVSLAAWLLARFEPDAFQDASEYLMLVNGVDSAMSSGGQLPSCAAPPPGGRKDPRDSGHETRPPPTERVRIFSDYEFAVETLRKIPSVELVENAELADFLLVTGHIQNFTSLPQTQRVCQFPYEGGFVRKDLLPLTVRRFCYNNCDGMEVASAPAWWLPCFDLTTEFHLFAAEHKRLSSTTVENAHTEEVNFPGWIIKPAQGTRGKGHRIVTAAGREGLLQAAVAAPQLPRRTWTRDNGGGGDAAGDDDDDDYQVEKDKVAQQLVIKPLLVQQRKFDMRVFVFVRSFVPFEAYMHELVYARLANKEYVATDDALQDSEVSITVCAYSDDPTIASKQSRLTRSQLKNVLEAENPGLSFEKLLDRVHHMLGELFSGVAPSVGRWPSSSAYYSVDVIFDTAVNTSGDEGLPTPPTPTTTTTAPPSMSSASVPTSSTTDSRAATTESTNDVSLGTTRIPQPKLIEVNFMGDWKGAKAAAESEEEYLQWAQDLIQCLSRTDAPDCSRCRRLQQRQDTPPSS